MRWMVLVVLAACGGGGGGGDDVDSNTVGDGTCATHDVTSASCWTTFDAKTLSSSIGQLDGGVFDGRYVYFTPNEKSSIAYGTVVRYDTQAMFASASAWQTFDAKTVDSRTAGMAGANFDGRYVYFLPTYNQRMAARYDTQADFTTSAAWQVFDVGSLGSGLTFTFGYYGSVFDGRYLYLVPSYTQNLNGDTVARFDTTMDFTSSASWQIKQLTSFNVSCNTFSGGLFDGRYVTLVPYDDGAQSDTSCRYDTQATFTDNAAWSIFHTTTLDADANAFSGGIFDGRYGYFAPTHRGVIVRFDSQADFTQASAWQKFNTSPLGTNAEGYDSGTFDGRYVYFSPNVLSSGLTPVLSRYDTHGTFTSADAWQTFDITSVNMSAFHMGGAIFDGHFVYFPGVEGVIARFDATDGGALPSLPAWHGSFL